MNLETFLYLAPLLLVSLVLHELAHAYVATWLGDPSPRADGRLSFNPIVHLDPLGTAMFAITAFATNFIFGWAKPVMINPRAFRRPQIDMAIVAAAGPATNLLLALGCITVLVHGDLGDTAFQVLAYAFQVNVVLGLSTSFRSRLSTARASSRPSCRGRCTRAGRSSTSSGCSDSSP